MSGRIRWILTASALAGSVVAGIGTGLVLGRDLPSVRALQGYRPPGITLVLAAGGEELQRYGSERRVSIPYSRIPQRFIDAVIATEDPRFRSHVGVDVVALFRVAWRHLVTRRWGVEGGSTITMQLAKKLFLSDEKTVKRKVQQMVLALRIEQVYSKEEIFGFYANQMYFGHGRYGVEAASQYFFGKPAGELDLGHAALLAGILQRPSDQSPLEHPDRALKRRRHVLRRMVSEGFLDEAEADAAASAEIEVRRAPPARPLAPYFVEEVRRTALERFGGDRLYREGLTVRTTVDPALQEAANIAVHEGLLAAARRLKDVPAGREPEGDGPAVPATLAVGDEIEAVVGAVDAASATVAVGPAEISVPAKAVRWTGKRPDQVFTPGLVYTFRVSGLDDDGVPAALEPLPTPTMQAALVAIEHSTGAVRALVGGFDFEQSEFDRAMQARRQAGSAFKPFVFAAALESGASPTDLVLDEPTVFVDPQTEVPYQPENFERDYEGLVTLRHALEHSRNIATVRLLNELAYQPVIDLSRRLGISAPLHPYPSLALGSMEVTLLELTAAYSVFPNQGVRVEPHMIEAVIDREGTTILSQDPDREPVQVMSPATAFQMVEILRGVMVRGTGKSARDRIPHPAGGKTGTTDDYSDAWFVGFTPELTVGVWVGRDLKEPLGRLETGARAALPIWASFLERALENRPRAEFSRPPSVTLVPIDRRTGRPAGLGTECRREDVILEAFVRGREPAGSCGPRYHQRPDLPYILHPYLDEEDDVIRLSGEELAAVTTGSTRAPRPSRDGRSLVFWRGDRVETLPLDIVGGLDAYHAALGAARRDRDARDQLRAVLAAEARRVLEEDPEAPSERDALPPGVRQGVDGWPASVVPVRR